jgi:hypothetical protein
LKVLIDRSFGKDTDKLTDQKLLHSIADCIEGILDADKLSDVPNCKKLKGSRHACRIRLEINVLVSFLKGKPLS